MTEHSREVQPTGPLHIALMGIDGAGKSTIAAALAEALRARGRTVEIASYKRAMAGASQPTSGILSHVAFASLKSQYAEAVSIQRAGELASLLADDDLSWSVPQAEGRLRQVPVERNAARPFLSSALLEIVGGVWVQAYVESRLQAGVDIIDESFAFKHAMKNVLFARRIAAPGSAVHEAARGVLDLAVSLFGEVLRPTYGYWVDTEPKLAWRWRTLSGDETTPFENYGLIGERGDEAFLAMQEDCRRVFETAARSWRWRRIAMSDAPRDEGVARVLEAIMGTALPETAG
jgi:hypothetical protein